MLSNVSPHDHWLQNTEVSVVLIFTHYNVSGIKILKCMLLHQMTTWNKLFKQCCSMVYNTTTQINGMVSNIRSHDRKMQLAKGVSKTFIYTRCIKDLFIILNLVTDTCTVNVIFKICHNIKLLLRLNMLCSISFWISLLHNRSLKKIFLR